VNGLGRNELVPSKTLVIWTAPPSPGVLKVVLEEVKPLMIYVFAVLPELDTLKTFLNRVAGMIKNVINNKNGETSLNELAVGMTHTTKTLEAGLEWLEAKGMIRIENQGVKQNGVENQGVKVTWGKEMETDDLPEVDRVLRILLKETAAFRKYFQTADPDSLFRYD
jgi:hypothetical protein